MRPREHSDGLGGASSASPSERAAPPSPPTPPKGKGRKKDAKEDDLSEEDLALKERLEQWVMQAQDPNPDLQSLALVGMRQEIRTATSSIMSVSKTIKFLRPHYGTLKGCFNTMPQSLKNSMADILSVLALTMSSEGERESLKYRLMGSEDDIGSWGHEYVRNLAVEITEVFQNNQFDGALLECLMDTVMKVAEFHMKHNAEPEAVDLLMEVMEVKDHEKKVEDLVQKIFSHLDYKNYKRTCLYIISCSKYLLAPDDQSALRIAYRIYMMFRDLVGALRTGLLLHCDEDNCPSGYAKRVFKETNDFHMKQQLAYIIARHGLNMEIEDDMVADDNQKEALQEIVYNSKMTESYLALARYMGTMLPKSPEDIYKVPLIDGQGATKFAGVELLAATFVNAFVNAGFGQDKLMTAPSNSSDGGSSEKWLFEEIHWKTSAVASLGMIFLWDSDSGLDQLGKCLDKKNNFIVAGACLGIGIVFCGKNVNDPELAFIHKYISSGTNMVRIRAILGLGIAYAGSQDAELRERFLTLRTDSRTLVVSVFSAISLGLVFVGSCNRDRDIEESIFLLSRKLSEEQPARPIIRLLPVALGLLYLGKQLSVREISEISERFPGKIKEYCYVTLMSLAYAGTGNVLKVQELLNICSQHLEEGETHQRPAVLGIALIAMAEELGAEMAVRSLEHLLQYSEQNIRRVVPLALGVLFISNPKVNVMDTLSRLSQDEDAEVSKAAIISLGLIGAGTNNARLARKLRKLAKVYYRKTDTRYLFLVRIAQGLVHLGKGLLTLSPYHSDRLLLSPKALAGLVTVLYACLDMDSIIFGGYHDILYILVLAMQPRMLLTVDEDLKPLPVPVHVGQAVDVVGQAGRPKTITGFQTRSTPVLLAAGERTELAAEEYDPLTPVLEGFVILKKN